MQRTLIVKGRSLGGSSDLTLLAPLKQGFVESLESVTYKTRAQRTLAALHGLRMTAHEYAQVRLVSDAVERISAIQSVRVAVFDESDAVMLAVTFDGPWESYIRDLWHKVGTLLDLVFCNTRGYVTAREHSFDDWEAWARRVQVESGFFYAPPEATARDALYHRRVATMDRRLAHEAQHAAGPDRDLTRLRTMLPGAEEQVRRIVDPSHPVPEDDPQLPLVAQSRMVRERLRNGLAGLAALYRLAELYRPGTADGEVLRQGALGLLLEFVQMRDRGMVDDELREERDGALDLGVAAPADGGRLRRALDWLLPAGRDALQARPAPPIEPSFRVPPSVRADVQAGVLHPYPRIDCGLLLLLAFDSRAAAASLLQALGENGRAITCDADLPLDGDDFDKGSPGKVYRQISFTAAGLRAAGLDEDELALFSEEFRQGMARRAGLLGDVHANHPLRWHLPRDEAGDPCDLDAVHAVLQLRCLRSAGGDAAALPAELQAEIDALKALTPAPRVLALQPLQRHYRSEPSRAPADAPEQIPQVIREHYGYADGDGQPDIEWDKGDGTLRRNHVPLGEVLLGHPNAMDRPLDAVCPHVQQQQRQRLLWQGNGSYLVMRKYRQQVERFNAAVTETAEAMALALDDALPGADRLEDLKRVVMAKLMGRYPDGRTVVASANPSSVNAFIYDRDADGRQCPLHAHVRRAHPRSPPGSMPRPPRLMRRSMSYGPLYDAAAEPAGQERERGLLFMAFNASLGEQFEVVQRWLVGGNSTGSASDVACPIVGTPQPGRARHFRFEYEENGVSNVFSLCFDALPPAAAGALPPNAFDEREPMTRLDWGLYLFTPSIGALQRLRERAAASAQPAVPWQLEHGREQLRRLARIEAEQGADAARIAWKAALEDPEAIDRLHSAALWAALRADHGGLLRTPYGVLVAERGLALQVYRDGQRQYSVCGQMDRMRQSFGEIALGLDDSKRYRDLSTAINDAIGRLEPQDAFDLARSAVWRRLQFIAASAHMQSAKVADRRVETTIDARELVDEVLAALGEAWFGLQDAPEGLFQRGPADWLWQEGQPPLYPGHFTALSRYMFQPEPGGVPVELGQAYGRSLRRAMRKLVDKHRDAGTYPKAPDQPGFEPYRAQAAPLAKAVLDDPEHQKDPATSNDLIARTLVGVLMGFTPTIGGALLNVLAEWHREGLFGALRQRMLGAAVPGLAAAEELLRTVTRDALRMRPMPQLGWRTATVDHRLGDRTAHAVDVHAGDRVVMSIVSGTQQSLADGADDGRLMFGGVRAGEPGFYPTHACPGYDTGMAVLYGALAGLMGWTGAEKDPFKVDHLLVDIQLRAGQGPHSVVLEAHIAPPPAQRDLPVAPPALTARDLPQPLPQAQGSPTILAWGDSWLDFPLELTNPAHADVDIRDWLVNFKYVVDARFCKYSEWPKSSSMAQNTAPFCEQLEALVLTGQAPKAILLSAGGNDSTGDALRALLLPWGGIPAQLPYDRAKLDTHVARIGANYDRIVGTILKVLDDNQVKVPILVHGYDHPLPRGKTLYGRNWLYKPFRDTAKLKLDSDPGHRKVAADTMAKLIDALNEEMKALAETRFKDRVFYVDLRGTLKPPDNTQDDWADDLHPKREAFAWLAKKVHEKIEAISSAKQKQARARAKPRKNPAAVKKQQP